MPLVDLDDPADLRARWAALAAVAHASGRDRIWWADAQGWHHEDARGNDLRLVPFPDGRAVVFGYHATDSRTAQANALADLLTGAPEWIGHPEVRHRIATSQLGFVYGHFSGTWARASYPGDPWQPLDDGFTSIASWLTDDSETEYELAEQLLLWAGPDLNADELRFGAMGLVRAAGTTGISLVDLDDFFGLLGPSISRLRPDGRPPDLAAGIAAAAAFGGPVAPAPLTVAAASARAEPAAPEQAAPEPEDEDEMPAGLIELFGPAEDELDDQIEEEVEPPYGYQPVEPAPTEPAPIDQAPAAPAPAAPAPIVPAPAAPAPVDPAPAVPAPAVPAAGPPPYGSQPYGSQPYDAYLQATQSQPSDVRQQPSEPQEAQPQPVETPAGVEAAAPAPVEVPAPPSPAQAVSADLPGAVRDSRGSSAVPGSDGEPEDVLLAAAAAAAAGAPEVVAPQAPPGRTFDSLEEAMRAEPERRRPRPDEGEAFDALYAWCRARTRIVPSGFTIHVYVAGPSAVGYSFDLEPPVVPDAELEPHQIGGLLHALWRAEGDDEHGSWMFARIDAAGRTVRIDRWYDSIPAWWQSPIADRPVEADDVAWHVEHRTAPWRPSYAGRLELAHSARNEPSEPG
jgi:hypothetical protein